MTSWIRSAVNYGAEQAAKYTVVQTAIKRVAKNKTIRRKLRAYGVELTARGTCTYTGGPASKVAIKTASAALEDALQGARPENGERAALLAHLCKALGVGPEEAEQDAAEETKEVAEGEQKDEAEDGTEEEKPAVSKLRQHGMDAIDSLLGELGGAGFLEQFLTSACLECLIHNYITIPTTPAEHRLVEPVLEVCLDLEPTAHTTLMNQLQALTSARGEHREEMHIKQAELVRAAADAVAALKRRVAVDALNNTIQDVGEMKAQMLTPEGFEGTVGEEGVPKTPEAPREGGDGSQGAGGKGGSDSGTSENLLYLNQKLWDLSKEKADVLERAGVEGVASGFAKWLEVMGPVREGLAGDVSKLQQERAQTETRARERETNYHATEVNFDKEDAKVEAEVTALEARKERLQKELGQVEGALYKARNHQASLKEQRAEAAAANVQEEKAAQARAEEADEHLGKCRSEEVTVGTWEAFLQWGREVAEARQRAMLAEAQVAAVQAAYMYMRSGVAHMGVKSEEGGLVVKRMHFCVEELQATHSQQEQCRALRMGTGVESQLEARVAAMSKQYAEDCAAMSVVLGEIAQLRADLQQLQAHPLSSPARVDPTPPPPHAFQAPAPAPSPTAQLLLKVTELEAELDAQLKRFEALEAEFQEMTAAHPPIELEKPTVPEDAGDGAGPGTPSSESSGEGGSTPASAGPPGSEGTPASASKEGGEDGEGEGPPDVVQQLLQAAAEAPQQPLGPPPQPPAPEAPVQPLTPEAPPQPPPPPEGPRQLPPPEVVPPPPAPAAPQPPPPPPAAPPAEDASEVDLDDDPFAGVSDDEGDASTLSPSKAGGGAEEMLGDLDALLGKSPGAEAAVADPATAEAPTAEPPKVVRPMDIS